jgi:hypothetical protein
MFLAYVPVVAMATGLLVHARNLQMAECALYGTTARYETERASEFGLLITILTAPWLTLTAVLLHI